MAAAMTASGRRRVVIVGAGFAGIVAVRALRHADAAVLLIYRRNHHIDRRLGPDPVTAISRSVERSQK